MGIGMGYAIADAVPSSTYNIDLTKRSRHNVIEEVFGSQVYYLITLY